MGAKVVVGRKPSRSKTVADKSVLTKKQKREDESREQWAIFVECEGRLFQFLKFPHLKRTHANQGRKEEIRQEEGRKEKRKVVGNNFSKDGIPF